MLVTKCSRDTAMMKYPASLKGMLTESDKKPWKIRDCMKHHWVIYVRAVVREMLLHLTGAPSFQDLYGGVDHPYEDDGEEYWEDEYDE